MINTVTTHGCANSGGLNDLGNDLAREQAELIALMEQSIDPDLLDAVQRAYDFQPERQEEEVIDISCTGTTYA